MQWFDSRAARAAVITIVLGLAGAMPAAAQRAQGLTPLADPVPLSQPAEPVVTAAPPADQPVGPRIQPAVRRADAVLDEPVAYRRKDSMNTITVSTLVLVLAIIIIVLLVK